MAPDDGNRYEVLDGALVVTPPPALPTTVVGELFVVLREAARSRGLRVFMAPLAWRIGPVRCPNRTSWWCRSRPLVAGPSSHLDRGRSAVGDGRTVTCSRNAGYSSGRCP